MAAFLPPLALPLSLTFLLFVLSDLPPDNLLLSFASTSNIALAFWSRFNVAEEKSERRARRAPGEGGNDMGVYMTSSGLAMSLVLLRADVLFLGVLVVLVVLVVLAVLVATLLLFLRC